MLNRNMNCHNKATVVRFLLNAAVVKKKRTSNEAVNIATRLCIQLEKKWAQRGDLLHWTIFS